MPAATITTVPPRGAAAAVPRAPAGAGAYRQTAGAVVAIQTPFLGFGQIRYAESPSAPPVAVPAGLRTALTFAIDPGQTQDYLNPPFAGTLEFDGAVITPRAYGDLIEILINLQVTAAVAGGKLKFDIDVGSPLGPTGADTADLFNAAGQPERVTGRLVVQALANFMTNGARLFLTATVPVTLINEAVLIIPRSAAVASP